MLYCSCFDNPITALAFIPQHGMSSIPKTPKRGFKSGKIDPEKSLNKPAAISNSLKNHEEDENMKCQYCLQDRCIYLLKI